MADYEKMWEDLGMDVKNHDNLCQVLPTAVGDVFMTQENRPKAMDFWDMVIAEVHGIRPAELIEEQKKGRKVFGTFCVYVPDEVIIAANGIVTGLCGGSQFWVPDGEKVLPKNVCPLVKASVGARLGRTCPFFRIADMYVGETTCDGKKKAYEILGKDVPMHIMDVPQMKREKDIRILALNHFKNISFCFVKVFIEVRVTANDCSYDLCFFSKLLCQSLSRSNDFAYAKFSRIISFFFSTNLSEELIDIMYNFNFTHYLYVLHS